MQHPGAQQTFGLGALVGPSGSTAPLRVKVEVEGRGVFARVRLNFEFSGGESEEHRLFLLEKPYDAVASALSLNGEPLPAQSGPSSARSVTGSQMQALEDALTVPSSHLLVVDVEAGTSLASLSVEFILAIDLQWHRGAFHFRSPVGERQVAFAGRWELSGLPGAGIGFGGAASACRLETLEGARHRWSEPLRVSVDEPAILAFSLDEKKAASLAVFSPGQGQGPGCAAVAVVAPVRPQLARESIRLAILVEVRSPQEGLLIRSMVDKVTALLKPQDELCVLLLGTDSPAQLVPWTGSDAVEEGLLSPMLEPNSIGRAPDLWGNLQALSPHLRTSTHLLVATAGTSSYPGKGLVSHTPVFVFATGRRPFKSQLESLAQRSGGFLMDGNADSLDTLVERMKIRLSPPLLSDFKLEGWALEQLRPSGATQVYTDQPTLVLGLYEGILPKTVTLSGQSPSRQKLAQRVKVESLEEIDLMPLYQDRLARWDGETAPLDRWTGQGATVRNISHAEALAGHYQTSLSSLASSSTMAIDMGGSPMISMEPTPIAFEQDDLLGAPGEGEEMLFGAGFDDPGFASNESTQPVLEAATSQEESSDLSASRRAPIIRRSEPFDPSSDEIDLFDSPSGAASSSQESESDDFEVPVGRPIIFASAESEDLTFDSDEAPSESFDSRESGSSALPARPVLRAPSRDEASFEEPSAEDGSLESPPDRRAPLAEAGAPSETEDASPAGEIAEPSFGSASFGGTFGDSPFDDSAFAAAFGESSFGASMFSVEQPREVPPFASAPAFEMPTGESLSGADSLDGQISLGGPALFEGGAVFDEDPVFSTAREQEEPSSEVAVAEELPSSGPVSPVPEAESPLLSDSAEERLASGEKTGSGSFGASLSRRPESSVEDSGRRRLLTWRQRQESDSAPASPEPAPAPVDRGPAEGWSSEWLESFQALEPDQARLWLESCSIDKLGLAASLLPTEVANGLLGQLSPQRQRAVRNQMEWGKLLETYECEEADHQLALALTRDSV